MKTMEIDDFAKWAAENLKEICEFIKKGVI
jgi:hypothetical protein